MKKNSALPAAIIAADQLTKYWARAHVSIFENSGLPFGIRAPGFFSFAVILAALIIFLFLYRRYFGSEKTVGWQFIVGGAVSNLLERAVRGRVTDFIDLKISRLNVADLAIFGGAMLLLCSKKFTARLS